MRLFSVIIFITCMLLYKPVSAQQHKLFNEVTFYLVRHAEKDTGSNPALKQVGYTRAGDLYRVLKNKKIDKIYVSQYRRTELTADSLRIYNKIDVVKYKVDENGNDLFEKIMLRTTKQNKILIIGHSNTIPSIIRRLGVTNFDITEIPDNEYDNLYTVTIKENKASLKIMKYGKASAPAEKTVMKPLQ